jgi:hypothetical protein
MLGLPLPRFHRWLWISQPWFESTSRSPCPSQQRGDTPLFLKFFQAGQCRYLAVCVSNAPVGWLITHRHGVSRP